MGILYRAREFMKFNEQHFVGSNEPAFIAASRQDVIDWVSRGARSYRVLGGNDRPDPYGLTQLDAEGSPEVIAEIITADGNILYYGLMAIEEGQEEFSDDMTDEGYGSLDSPWDLVLGR